MPDGGVPPPVLAVVGPTATGKTALAVELARRLGGEVISVDSRQAYAGLAIGTGAPTPEEMRGVPHHGIGFLSPTEPYGAGRFARFARRWLEEAARRGHVPILAGGTGLFLDALLRPVFREPVMDPLRRRRLRAWLAERSPAELGSWVARLDSELQLRLPRLDRQRAERTLELALLSGRPVTWWQDHGEPEAPPVGAQVWVLELPTAVHRARIEARVREQLARGWAEEVRALLAAGHEGAPALDAVGYRDVVALVRGEITEAEARARIVKATWAYARRQRTWFRSRPPGARRLDARTPGEQLAERIAAAWRSEAAGATRAGNETSATGE